MDICVDFDGTCVTHAFPNIGKDIGAVPVLQDLVNAGHKLILFTMRSDVENVPSPEIDGMFTGTYLTDAVQWFNDNNIPLYGINVNPTQHVWTRSPKAYGQLIIDDIALGTPLIYPEGERPYVDWSKVRIYLEDLDIL
jgi:hypothetical protein